MSDEKRRDEEPEWKPFDEIISFPDFTPSDIDWASGADVTGHFTPIDPGDYPYDSGPSHFHTYEWHGPDLWLHLFPSPPAIDWDKANAMLEAGEAMTFDTNALCPSPDEWRPVLCDN